MKSTLKFTLIYWLCLIISAAHAEDPDLAHIFGENHVQGTILISSLDGEIEYVYNKARSEIRFTPASTFKIPNTLIALEEKAVLNEKEIIKWDGKDKGWSKWNKDQSMETAFPLSCVWFYQELARRVGNDRYLSHLQKMEYGNRKTGPDLTTFWLDGDLKISAREQIWFLKRLFTGDLPYGKSHIQLLKKLMIVEKTPRYTIRAKTGWVYRKKKQVGWYVGYVESNHQVWFFALNIDIHAKKDAAYRKKIVMQALRVKAVI